ncbi:ph-response sensor protein [Lithohypha guttulata]|nr:ph-response sensor protein [Lithohypha guttulata]
MPFESLFTNPNPPVERSKSILSRFSNPLTTRAAKLFDLEIHPEHPHKTYRPGDSVKGQITLSVFKGFDITHLAISLHGYARVFKHQCTPGEAKIPPDQLINGKGSHGFEYFGNGTASLFQDEQVLCGSGFLKKQVYKFGFELQFPAYSLPSTLVFERGVVNYMISATVTRPVTIGATTNKIYKVDFKDRIDIESMYTPKSRAIYLEPMSRLGKVKKVKQPHSAGTQSTSITAQDTPSTRTLSRQNTSNSTQTRSSTVLLQAPPLSPSPSEDTVATNATTSTPSLHIVDRESADQPKRSDDSAPRSSTTSNSAHTISATAQIQRHGALPGDYLPVRVRVEHTKPVRGVVIATLYRVGRIDMLPTLPIANRYKDKKPEYEDVYPKSKTGLGGLYFTNGAPNMAFRNDLTQKSTMMIVNPHTKTADVNFKVRIPNEEVAFPTMDNIQGGMISFTYHLEIVIDLTGKLGESRLLPSLTTNGPTFSKAADDRRNLTHEWTDINILDTAPLRRTKNVATFELPLIVGTDDSGRARRTNLQREYSYHDREAEFAGSDPDGYGSEWQSNGHNGYEEHYDYYGYDPNGWYDEYGNLVYDNYHDHYQSQHYPPDTNDPYHNRSTYQYQPPPPEPEEHIDEKSRLRRQEELLLPSQPPEAEPSSSRSATLAPSAPVLDNDGVPASNHTQPSIPITISRASARSGDTIVPDPLTPPPSLPTPTEDKQELERRRLEAQASAPPLDDDSPSGSSHTRSTDAPSAPVIDDEAEYIVQVLNMDANDTLPQYRR